MSDDTDDPTARELRNYFYYWSLVMVGVLTLHFITTVIVFSAQCIPMEKYWAPSTPGHCISITGFFYCKFDRTAFHNTSD